MPWFCSVSVAGMFLCSERLESVLSVWQVCFCVLSTLNLFCQCGGYVSVFWTPWICSVSVAGMFLCSEHIESVLSVWRVCVCVLNALNLFCQCGRYVSVFLTPWICSVSVAGMFLCSEHIESVLSVWRVCFCVLNTLNLFCQCGGYVSVFWAHWICSVSVAGMFLFSQCPSRWPVPIKIGNLDVDFSWLEKHGELPKNIKTCFLHNEFTSKHCEDFKVSKIKGCMVGCFYDLLSW